MLRATAAVPQTEQGERDDDMAPGQATSRRSTAFRLQSGQSGRIQGGGVIFGRLCVVAERNHRQSPGQWVARYSGAPSSRRGSFDQFLGPYSRHTVVVCVFAWRCGFRAAPSIPLLTPTDARTHKQVKQISELDGISHFLPPADEDDEKAHQWREWRRWPHMTLAMDMGSDNMSAYHWMMHKGFNLSAIWDWSHGCSNDWKTMLKDSSLMPFWALMIVAWNSACGPHRDMLRWKQLAEAWDCMFSNYTAGTCPLFGEYASAIIRDRGGYSALTGEGQAEEQLWAMLREEPPCRQVQRVNLNRYFASPRRAADEVGRWHQTLMTSEFVAIEEGMISGARLAKLVVRDRDGVVDGERQSTNPAVPNLSDRALKANGDNSIVIAISMLGDEMNLATVRIIVESGLAAEAWHGEQNRTLRASLDSATWLCRQMGGEFFTHVHEIFGRLEDVGSLERCRILAPLPDADITEHNDHVMEVTKQDELAFLLGRCTTSLASSRVVRTLWAVGGWPTRFVGLLGSADQAQVVADAFKDDLESFRAFERQAEKTAAVQRLLQRTVFRQMPVRQFVEVV